MTTLDTLLQEASPATIRRGIVVRLEGTEVTVTCGDENPVELKCAVLQCGEGEPLRLASRDTVLVWQHPEKNDDAVILGRIGPSHAAKAQAAAQEVPENLPEQLVIEAKSSLTLRVGSGSITIREDGKILIKGKDLVSHATRLNRIKGGAVQIN